MPSHPVDVYVGKRLRMRRTMLGMSQEALGRAIGVTFQQIQKYERGVNRIGSSRLYDFSRVLSVPVAFFFENYEVQGVDGGKPQDQAAGMKDSAIGEFEHERLSSRETLEIMRNYHRITGSKVRKRIAEMIKALADAEPA